MKIKNVFEMPREIGRAKIIQQNLSGRVIFRDDPGGIARLKTVAGCDVSYSKNEKDMFSAVVVLDLASLKPLEKIRIRYKNKSTFPYVPGYLSFREGPALLEAIRKLRTEPDVFIFDGQGIAHPRGIGIAAHLGVTLDKPSIGCAKSLLYGNCDEPPPAMKGAYTFLKDDAGTLIGLTMRSRQFTKPIFMPFISLITDLCPSGSPKYSTPA